MRSLSSVLSLPRHEAAALGYNLVLLLLLALSIALGAAGLLDRQLDTADGEPVSGTAIRNISGVQLTIPASWLRNGAGSTSGLQTQVDLSIDLSLPTTGRVPVELTLVPRSRVRASAAMLDAVYVHHFESETLDGPQGLVGKPLKAGAGLAGESVWYDPLSADPFVARCLPGLRLDQPDRCLRTVVLRNGLAAALTFPSPAMIDWRDFDAALIEVLRRMGAI